VFTGYGRLISEHLKRELKVEANPLPPFPQKSIQDY
jgi:hypothetical protein